MANSKRRCLNCKAYFSQDIMLRTPVGYFHTHGCASEYAQNKRQALKTKNLAKRTREQKERLKTRSEWIKDAQKVVNQYVRLRDEDRECISCAVNKQGVSNYWDAGHYRSIGSAPHLRFYTLNNHKQCKRCNRDLSGNAVEYRKGLRQRFSEEYIERLEALQFELRPDIDYLKRLIKVFKKKIKLYNRLFRNKN